MDESFQTIKIGHIYEMPEFWPLYEASMFITGWRKSLILSQWAQVYGKKAADYYGKAAELDAEARGLSLDDHYDLLVSGDELPRYVGPQPAFEPSPIADISDPPTGTPRHSFGQFRCSSRTAALLRMAMIVDRLNVNILMTRLAVWYYPKYWGSNYEEQIASVEQKRICPDMSKFELKL